MTLTAIAGLVSREASWPLEESCSKALGGLRLFGAFPVIETVKGASFGALAYKAAASASHSPVADPRFLCVADARLDNRQDLEAALGLPPGSSSSALILAAWGRWGPCTTDHLIGDYAFAVHERSSGDLWLVRDPAGYRPLFFSESGDGVAFASMPSGLLAVEARSANQKVLAQFLDGSGIGKGLSIWAGISRAPAGEIVHFHRHGLSSQPCLRPRRCMTSKADWSLLVHELRDRLDRAVARAIEAPGAIVGAHLSSGIDSNAVLATAARQANGRPRIVALTAAPADRAALLYPRGRYPDESELAAASALASGVEHHIFRDDRRFLDSVRGVAQHFQQPAPALFGFSWWRGMNDWLRERGGEVLLTAGLGNASISYGGLPALPLYLRRFRLLDWLREVIALHSNENVRWRGLLFNSFEPVIPEGIAGRLRNAAAGVPSKEMVSFVRAEWRALAPAPDPWPRDYFAGRLAQIGGFDAGSRNRGMAALTGIEERDPTGDRELIDFSLNLPPDALVGRGRIKPLVRDALADRVPMPILSNRLRGYSSADWYSRIDQADCRKALEDIAASRTARDLLDIAAIARAIDRWPAYDPAKAPALTAFGNRLAKALSTGLFLAETDRYPLGA